MDDYISRQAAIDALECVGYDFSESGLSNPELEELCGAIGEVEQDMIMRIRHLPSAPPEHIRINLNEPIKVKLTDWGKEIYYHQYNSVNQIARREICKPEFPKEDENGYTEFQLWCFIELYGEYMGMTLPNVIEPLEIVYERSE